MVDCSYMHAGKSDRERGLERANDRGHKAVAQLLETTAVTPNLSPHRKIEEVSHNEPSIYADGEEGSKFRAVSSEECESGSSTPRERDVALFGNGKKNHVPCEDCNETVKWIKRFKSLRQELEIGKRRGELLKVAILDTGIDMTHPDFEYEPRIAERISWFGGSADVDEDGHGTHLAGIILDLAMNVELYIGKIMTSRYVTERTQIVEALKHARTKWNVDMISLSFGYRVVDNPDNIQTEIKSCLDKGIVVFASASNDGGTRDRTYPAEYNRALCIHASNGKGNNWKDNPTPLLHRDNFSVVGVCILSSWPVNLLKGDEKKKKHQTGTSFATAVAVSIAAFMIGYVHQHMPEYKWNTKPWEPDGMVKIFQILKDAREGYDWVCPERYIRSLKVEPIKPRLLRELGGYNITKEIQDKNGEAKGI